MIHQLCLIILTFNLKFQIVLKLQIAKMCNKIHFLAQSLHAYKFNFRLDCYDFNVMFMIYIKVKDTLNLLSFFNIQQVRLNAVFPIMIAVTIFL